ncbi:sigma-70 family RNA polymerase sigma factor [Achromobacter mucicolens]|uniref:sigma-70 family RNA polymerase sigma factor n=1 Tax=Achromobacter mucicolens TaxID=1389922 RepID=UPI0022F3A583|nr:sigma-70 family RNA polymerase sigma factor [Achromobacter mucicolens]WBX88640.1 sigma-70 family RNA polymerase sigma factor [Achromobacter mucicolens]
MPLSPPVIVSDSLTSPSVEALYCDHHHWLRSWLLHRLGNTADAADLAHDTFLRLLGKTVFPHFGSVGEARAYLRTVGHALCVDLWRRREVERAWLDALAAQPELVAPSLEHQAIIIETLLAVGRMLGRLSEKAAAAFVMAQVDGTPYRDIAATLGVSERMIKKYIAQAMLQCALIEAGLNA